MRAGVITGLAQFELLDVLEPTPSPTGAVIEIQLCGVCGSDLHAYREGLAVPAESVRPRVVRLGRCSQCPGAEHCPR